MCIASAAGVSLFAKTCNSVKLIRLVLLGDLYCITGCQQIFNSHVTMVIFGDANQEQQLCLRKCYLLQKLLQFKRETQLISMQWSETPLEVWVVVVVPLLWWGCLTHTYVTDRPEPWATCLALEGAQSVDTDTVGTGVGISALIHIYSMRRWGMKIIIWISVNKTMCTCKEKSGCNITNANIHKYIIPVTNWLYFSTLLRLEKNTCVMLPAAH